MPCTLNSLCFISSPSPSKCLMYMYIAKPLYHFLLRKYLQALQIVPCASMPSNTVKLFMLAHLDKPCKVVRSHSCRQAPRRLLLIMSPGSAKYFVCVYFVMPCESFLWCSHQPRCTVCHFASCHSVGPSAFAHAYITSCFVGASDRSMLMNACWHESSLVALYKCGAVCIREYFQDDYGIPVMISG